MGTAPKPICILVHPEIEGWPEFTELRAKGHIIAMSQDLKLANVTLDKVDLILGPTCWRMTPQLRKYLPLALAAARAQRYPKSG